MHRLLRDVLISKSAPPSNGSVSSFQCSRISMRYSTVAQQFFVENFRRSTTFFVENFRRSTPVFCREFPQFQNRYSSRISANFEQVFRGPKPAGVDKEKWKRILRLVLIPKVVQWLSRLAKKNTDPVLNNTFEDGALIFDEESLKQLNEFAKNERLPRILGEDTVVTYSIDAINKAIRSTFSNLFNNYAKIIAVFEVDMVVVTGKPSELPEVENLLHQSLPLMPNRIISAKGYPAGTVK